MVAAFDNVLHIANAIIQPRLLELGDRHIRIMAIHPEHFGSRKEIEQFGNILDFGQRLHHNQRRIVPIQNRFHFGQRVEAQMALITGRQFAVLQIDFGIKIALNDLLNQRRA